MKTLLSSTALAVALGFPAMTYAQTTDTTQAADMQQSGQGMGFLSARSQSDLYASELMGQDVYARRADVENNDADDQLAGNANHMNGMATMNRADMDGMDNIGQINEIMLSHDGQVHALVIGVGGFLGLGEQDVAVKMDQITFATDAEDASETYIVMNTGSDMLMDAPVYDRTTERADAASNRPQARDTAVAGENDEMTTPTDGQERTAFMAPDMQRDGYNRVEAINVSTEMLMDRTVYDVNDNDVGDVDDMIINDAGEITDVIIDFGGFLGIGSSQASLSFDELTVMSDDGNEDVRLYVDATKEQIQDLPEYMAAN